MNCRRPALLALTLVAAVPVMTAAQVGATASSLEPKAAFDRLKGLVGRWEGAHTTAEGPPMVVEYSLTGAGSALVERLFAGSPHEMLSVYYLDGSDLVLTHYCSIGNQPRMKLVSGGSQGELVFDFAGGSNLDPATSPHIHNGRIAILAPDRFDAEWQGWNQGRPADAHRLFMRRVVK